MLDFSLICRESVTSTLSIFLVPGKVVANGGEINEGICVLLNQTDVNLQKPAFRLTLKEKEL